ncbi:hypothetical protein TNCV_427781 [Trichonephila clavipes]|nr:hypothetical protein TNCV_427781 [Trichonephila clavipes]
MSLHINLVLLRNTRAVGEGCRNFEPHGRITSSAPKLASPTSDYHTAPSSRTLSLTDLTCISPLYPAGLRWHQDSNTRYASHGYWRAFSDGLRHFELCQVKRPTPAGSPFS